ncbi:hypothetical protein BKA70DRAFT_1234350 [Coprinopsis sp. MPI-PUGE-AT-0042]|nr:hypothetical protein BKA70DRAFT_1234350 [Coprinopsis sp. MPI-PUGE-AT-0042]
MEHAVKCIYSHLYEIVVKKVKYIRTFTGLPLDLHWTLGEFTYERWSLTKDAKAVYNAHKNIPRLPPSPPDAPLSSQPWPANFKIKEEDIVDILSNKTTWGKSEDEIFLAKPGTKGIGLVFSFQGLSNKGKRESEGESEHEKQKERQRRLAEQAEVQQTEANGKKKKKKKKKDSKKDRKATVHLPITLHSPKVQWRSSGSPVKVQMYFTFLTII